MDLQEGNSIARPSIFGFTLVKTEELEMMEDRITALLNQCMDDVKERERLEEKMRKTAALVRQLERKLPKRGKDGRFTRGGRNE
jgi:superfamily II RNA helicase